MVVDEAGVELPAAEIRISENLLIVGGSGLYALHAHVVQCARATGQRLFPGQCPDDQLQAHGVVVRRDGVAGVDRRIGAHTGAAGGVVTGDLAEAGQEVVTRLLGVDAELQGEAAILDVFLLDRERQTGGDADLLADDVDAGDFLGDGVLHLHAGVHFHEVHLTLGEQELHGAGVLVTHRLGRTHGQVADIGALFRGELRAGGDLDEFLVAPLNRAIALEQVHGVAERVGENLRLDVLGLDDAFLKEYISRSEGFGRLGDDARVGLGQLFSGVAAPDTATATARGGFEHHRIADALSCGQRFFDIRHVAFGAGRDRHASLDHAAPRLGLVTHASNHFGAGANEADSALGADFRQFGVFGQESVAWMQRITAGLHGQVYQLARIQVARQRVLANKIGLVGTFDVQRVAVGLGKHRHRAHVHFGTGPHDADGDFTAVSDQQLLDHAVIPSVDEQKAAWRGHVTPACCASQ